MMVRPGILPSALLAMPAQLAAMQVQLAAMQAQMQAQFAAIREQLAVNGIVGAQPSIILSNQEKVFQQLLSHQDFLIHWRRYIG
jgi:hypothetical protein